MSRRSGLSHSSRGVGAPGGSGDHCAKSSVSSAPAAVLSLRTRASQSWFSSLLKSVTRRVLVSIRPGVCAIAWVVVIRSSATRNANVRFMLFMLPKNEEGRPQPPFPTTVILRIRHRAVAAASVDPIALDQVVFAAQRQVVLRAGRTRDRAKGPSALVGVLFTAPVIPGIQVGIRDRFFLLVSNDADHAVRAGIAIRRLLLRARS